MATELKRAKLEAAVLSAMDRACSSGMQWGVDDCSMWCADILLDALGYDAAARFRGRYKTRLGAMRVLGHGGVIGALNEVASANGWRTIEHGFEHSGDIGIISNGKIASAAICRSPGWFVARDRAGYAGVPTVAVAQIWAVI